MITPKSFVLNLFAWFILPPLLWGMILTAWQIATLENLMAAAGAISVVTGIAHLAGLWFGVGGGE